MTDPWPIAHAVQRALQRAGLDAGAERVGASNWLVSVSHAGRRGAIRIAPADSGMLRDDVVRLLDDAGWDAQDGLADVALLTRSTVPLADRIQQAVAAACSRLGADISARRTALAALDDGLPDLASSADLIAIAEHAVTSAGIDVNLPLSKLASEVVERLRPFDVPATRLNGVAWRLVIEAIGPVATHRIGTLYDTRPGVREIVGDHLSELLISTPAASLDDARAATWDLLRPYPLSWRTQQADWIEHWSFSPTWRTAIADSRLAGRRQTGISSVSASASFRHVASALVLCDRSTLAALALATFPRTGDAAWTVVSAAQASLTDPLNIPDLSDLEAGAVEPYRTGADLLDDLGAVLDSDDAPNLLLRDRAKIEAYRDAVDLTPDATGVWA